MMITMENIFDEMAAKAAERIKAEQGDYYKNGVLHCGKCRSAKEVLLERNGKSRRQGVLCKCESERRDARYEEESRIKLIEERRERCFAEERMKRWIFANDDGTNAELSNTAQKYVENFERMKADGKGLLLFGRCGTGKTFAAACIANALIDRSYRCLVTSFPRIGNEIMQTDSKQEYIDKLNRFDLLIIDDLESERNTEYMGEIVQNVIESRYGAGLPLIVTTNLTAEELKTASDIRRQRVYSRLFDMCLPVEVKGKDRRRERLKDDFKIYKDILGL
ncbi:MAG: ATP-binding protein [Clostridiales bacterium]|nr:ATP-binding protein [Clostridiales bacterium]